MKTNNCVLGCCFCRQDPFHPFLYILQILFHRQIKHFTQYISNNKKTFFNTKILRGLWRNDTSLVVFLDLNAWLIADEVGNNYEIKYLFSQKFHSLSLLSTSTTNRFKSQEKQGEKGETTIKAWRSCSTRGSTISSGVSFGWGRKSRGNLSNSFKTVAHSKIPRQRIRLQNAEQVYNILKR